MTAIVAAPSLPPPALGRWPGWTVRPLGPAGLMLVAVLLGIVAVTGGWSAWRERVDYEQAVSVRKALAVVLDRVEAEGRLFRAAQAPHPALMERLTATTAEVTAALARARQLADPAGRGLLEALGTLHASTAQMLTLALEIGPRVQPGPALDRLRATLEAVLHQADQSVARLYGSMVRQVATLVALVGAVLLSALGCGLYAGLVRRRFERLRAIERQRTAAALASAERFRSLYRHGPDMVLLFDAMGQVAEQNAAAETVWGHMPGGLLDRPVHHLVHPADRVALQAFWQVVEATQGEPRRLPVQVADAAGRWRAAELIATNLGHCAGVGGIVLHVRDVSDRRASEDTQHRAGLFDPVTRLPNEALTKDRIGQALLRAARSKDFIGVLSIRFDGLQELADRHGAPAADDALLQLAGRIRTALRPQDTVARLSADEFIVVCEGLPDPSKVDPVVDALIDQVSRPVALEDAEVALEPSVGVAIGNPRRDNTQGLLRAAGLARLTVRPGQAARSAVFAPDMAEAERDRQAIADELSRPEAVDEMQVHYQPSFSMATGRLRGLEALVRWEHPRLGSVSPRSFLPAAESLGLVVPIGARVLRDACRATARWQADGRFDPKLGLSVNLSAGQLYHPDLVDMVAGALQESGLDPACLTLEVAEASLMQGGAAAIEVLWRLKRLGVRLSVDDFGAGYSSLPYLKQLPIDQLKIDLSFISGIGQDREDNAIVRATIALGRTLDLEVTAEGIETEEQARLLESWGCSYGQGYHFGRPMDAARTGAMLQEGASPASLEAAA